jgi:peptidoglycan-associated lipoprotein
MSKQKAFSVLSFFLVASLAFLGCAKHYINTEINKAPIEEKPVPEAQEPLNVCGLSSSELAEKVVHFGYDSAALDPIALKTTEEVARLFQSAPNAKIMIEGHCDERGTQEYNLVLGQKRADIVREQLIRLGVAADRLQTISYGKERPSAQGQTEQAYALNRRCEFKQIR